MAAFDHETVPGKPNAPPPLQAGVLNGKIRDFLIASR